MTLQVVALVGKVDTSRVIPVGVDGGCYSDGHDDDECLAQHVVPGHDQLQHPLSGAREDRAGAEVDITEELLDTGWAVLHRDREHKEHDRAEEHHHQHRGQLHHQH